MLNFGLYSGQLNHSLAMQIFLLFLDFLPIFFTIESSLFRRNSSLRFVSIFLFLKIHPLQFLFLYLCINLLLPLQQFCLLPTYVCWCVNLFNWFGVVLSHWDVVRRLVHLLRFILHFLLVLFQVEDGYVWRLWLLLGDPGIWKCVDSSHGTDKIRPMAFVVEVFEAAGLDHLV